MNSVTERYVVVRRASGVEALGIVEVAGVPVGGGEHHHQLVPPTQLLAAEREIRRLHAEIAKAATDAATNGHAAARLAELHERLREAEQRHRSLREQVSAAQQYVVSKTQVDSVLAEFDALPGITQDRDPRRATIDSKPELEIYADDVKCSHGSTTGQLDNEALFYLTTRGIPQADAERMLINAFAAEVLEKVEIGPLRNYFENAVKQRFE